MAKVELIDLSEVDQDTFSICLVKDGPLHKMVPLSVLNFVRNMQDLKSVQDGDLEGEVKVIHTMIQRSFPSLPMEEIEKFTMDQVHMLQNAISKVMSKAQEGAEAANPPSAAPSVGSTSDSSSPA